MGSAFARQARAPEPYRKAADARSMESFFDNPTTSDVQVRVQTEGAEPSEWLASSLILSASSRTLQDALELRLPLEYCSGHYVYRKVLVMEVDDAADQRAMEGVLRAVYQGASALMAYDQAALVRAARLADKWDLTSVYHAAIGLLSKLAPLDLTRETLEAIEPILPTEPTADGVEVNIMWLHVQIKIASQPDCAADCIKFYKRLTRLLESSHVDVQRAAADHVKDNLVAAHDLHEVERRALRALLATKGTASVEVEAAKGSFNHCSNRLEQLKNVVVASDCVPPLVRLLRSSCQSVQRSAATCVGHLGRDIQSIIRSGGIKALSELLMSTDAGVQTAAAVAVRELSHSMRPYDPIREHLIPALLALLQSNGTPTAAAAATAEAWCTIGDEVIPSDDEDADADDSIMVALVPFLDSDDQHLVHVALEAIYVVHMGNEDHRLMFAALHGLEMVVSLIVSSHHVVKAASLLLMFVQNSTHVARIVRAGAVPLLRSMASHGPTVQHAADVLEATA